MASSDVATQNPSTLLWMCFVILSMPWPYASAFTTGKNLEECTELLRLLRLKSKAFRSISTNVGRFNSIFF